VNPERHVPSCRFCHDGPDSPDHCFLECSKTKALKDLAEFELLMEGHDQIERETWLWCVPPSNTSQNERIKIWNVLGSAKMIIWNERNKLLERKSDHGPPGLSLVDTMVDKLSKALSRLQTTNDSTNTN